MKIDLTDELEMLRVATGQLAQKYEPSDPRVLPAPDQRFDRGGWSAGAELAWPAMLVPESYGGARESGGLLAAAVVAEELGAALQPWPFVEANVVADALARAADPELCGRYLPDLVAGKWLVSWAVAEDDRSWDGRGRGTVAEADGIDWVLSGRKVGVVQGGVCDHYLVTATGVDGPVQLLVPASAPGVSITAGGGLDLTRGLAEVRFDRVELDAGAAVGQPGDREAPTRQLDLASLLSTLDAIGATQRLFNQTVEYASSRVAFGRPIGGFQAVKHQLADGVTWLEAAQAAAWRAVEALDADEPDAREFISVAKAFGGTHCPRIVQMCMQVHGGIAMTWEHRAHLYLRRVRTDDALYGSARWHRDRVCQLAGMGVAR
jgi:alkylation response protein AidB-like acyl-CoA dehydrogenase